MYDIGILGGLGPKATAMLFETIVDSTAAQNDQEHLRVAVLNKPQIPDRSAYLLQKNAESPLPALKEGIEELNRLEAKYILIPCNTAHYFYPELKRASNGSVINMVDNALRYIAESGLPEKVYILGTLGTVQTKIYDRYNSYGLSLCYLSGELCEEIHRMIYEVKQGDIPLSELAQKLSCMMDAIRRQEGNVTFVLGCTELSCLQTYLPVRDNVVDPMTLSALAAIILSEAKPTCIEPYDLGVLAKVARESVYAK